MMIPNPQLVDAEGLRSALWAESCRPNRPHDTRLAEGENNSNYLHRRESLLRPASGQEGFG